MTTKGKFYVRNESKYPITGSVTYHEKGESRIEFIDLLPKSKTDEKGFTSGAATKDTWYYDYSQNSKAHIGSKDCAFYAKDQVGPVEIIIGDDYLKVVPAKSGSCVKEF
ncbi:hypothetical protein [Vibrio sp. SCSIO 43169]|uniref:hypothetical protein n=1 Tax=Vibrio sp. SCSIO 43169 TaxID=2822801 RepID=UPI002043E324|nr:hypothetical protein [Vibrio sp. SCSIO 43169]MCM5509776.1 hypothetical protein [Vibrio sp. SCSIO 43169]